MNILKPNLARMITSVRSTNSPNLVQIGCEMKLPHGGEIQRFRDLLLPPFSFLCFLGQPMGRNFGPNCTLNDSKVVFRLIHVPFVGLVP